MSEPETCDERMNPVAGGGVLYCNALKGHEGLHSHTFPGVFVGNAGLNLFSRVPSGCGPDGTKEALNGPRSTLPY